MRSGRIEYRAEVAAIVLTSALLVKTKTRDCAFMLGVPLLVRERLNLPHARIRTIDETTTRARLERNVRRNHISGVGKIEAVEGFDQVTRYVVNMDTAAALCGAGVRL